MKTIFDKIYCLHLSSETERYDSIKNELKKIGLINDVEFWWTCKRKISEFCGLVCESLHTSDYDNVIVNNNLDAGKVYGGVFNCALEHYTMVRTSFERGFNNILIMEDDVRFIDNIKLIEDSFNNIPKDYTVIKYYDTISILLNGNIVSR